METLKLKGTYHLQIKGSDGQVKDAWSVSNLVTNAGFAQLALLAGDATAVPFTYLAVGTSSTAPAVANTTLGAEITDTGLERASGTVSRTTTNVANDTYQVTYTWAATGSKVIEEIGVFNAASSGSMLSRALTGTKTMSNGEELTAVYTLEIA
jgi:hypothetical protein